MDGEGSARAATGPRARRRTEPRTEPRTELRARPRREAGAEQPSAPSARPTRSRAVAATAAAALAVGALALHPSGDGPATAQDAALDASTAATIDLYQEGVALTGGRGFVQVAPGSGATYLVGTRVLGTAPQPTVLAARTRDWLASGDVPGAGTRWDDLGRDAILDLHALVGPEGAVVAGPSPYWRYVWPRDASFAAAAMARTGHADEALRILGFLGDVQGDDGSFQARYLPDASGVPDDRGAQSDGAGWVLWATDLTLTEIARSAGPSARLAAADELGTLVERSTAHLLDQVATDDGLPLASPDYWELPTDTLTLGTAAPILAGLEAALRMSDDAAPAGGDVAAREEVALATDRLRAAIVDEFGSQGYPREVDGGPRDAATAFLLPPFQPTALHAAERAWARSVPDMLRPAGGLAPGGSWRDDGVSWTPQTTLYAYAAAANGHRVQAEHWLTWIDEHRTGTGAIPEKVLADGSPAAVAPLAWSAALTVLALTELDPARTDPLAAG
ncbi:hypothetical protein GCM10025865_19480 [Paraoerskovia sediminicola]|uniref:Glycoside hydrolase family 15 n=1 Tax=Paraoerskovia sediminicola TaxID=1138587 RepID=A0ABM8G3M9_9CELL|nr:glycoside hydrolase family 15 [Paraoerskovia sediminicola]BDZ42649.1 hypothetical protein GCM10025865_19480 [Paraoerskovia sediminicola]